MSMIIFEIFISNIFLHIYISLHMENEHIPRKARPVYQAQMGLLIFSCNTQSGI